MHAICLVCCQLHSDPRALISAYSHFLLVHLAESNALETAYKCFILKENNLFKIPGNDILLTTGALLLRGKEK